MLDTDAKWPCNQALQGFFNNGLLSDFEVRCGASVFRVNRIILAMRSKYFERLFKSTDLAETQQNSIDLHDDDPAAVEVMLKMFYGFDYPTFEDAVDAENLKAHAANLLIADKYACPSMEKKAFLQICRGARDAEFNPLPVLAEVMSIVASKRVDRETFIAVWKERSPKWKHHYGAKVIRGFIREHPDLGVAIALDLADQERVHTCRDGVERWGPRGNRHCYQCDTSWRDQSEEEATDDTDSDAYFEETTHGYQDNHLLRMRRMIPEDEDHPTWA